LLSFDAIEVSNRISFFTLADIMEYELESHGTNHLIFSSRVEEDSGDY